MALQKEIKEAKEFRRKKIDEVLASKNQTEVEQSIIKFWICEYGKRTY